MCLIVKIVLGVLLISFVSLLTYDLVADAIDPKKDDKHCECIDYDCGCCTDLQIKNIIEGRLCTNFSYLPKDYGISVTITYNNLDIFNETVSARNPPPVCIIHIDKIQMEICLHFYKLDIRNKCLYGCAEFEISFFKVIPLKKLQLGCFGCKETSLEAKFENVIDYFRYKVINQEKSEPYKIVLI